MEVLLCWRKGFGDLKTYMYVLRWERGELTGREGISGVDERTLFAIQYGWIDMAASECPLAD